MALAVAAKVASTIGTLSLQSFYSSVGAVHEATIGTLLRAIGVFIAAAAALVFAAGARRPLVVRERALFGASVVAVFATVCLVTGEALFAYGYSNNGGAAWEQSVAWLAVAARVLLAAFVALALGARTVREDSALGAARTA